jgi:hypothetical protein
MASWFQRGFGAALADIRQRIVEEPWFGKPVTPRSQTISIHSPSEKSPGDGLGWSHPNRQPERGVDHDR